MKVSNIYYRALVFAAMVVILDLVVGRILNHYYFTQRAGEEFRATYAIEKSNADIVIIGASRANHQYHPEIFENRLQMTCYNAGRDGSSMFYYYGILKAITSRYSPKVIILDFSRDFEMKQNSYDRLAMLAPYYEKHPEIRPVVELKSKYEKYKMLSSIYPFNSYIFAIAQRNTNFNIQNHTDTKGYTPLHRRWNRPINSDTSFLNYEIDTLKVAVYRNFIEECLASKINLVIASSPFYNNSDRVDPSTYMAKQIAKSYGISFIDFSKDSTFRRNPGYFADISHLNEDGAIVLSNRIIDSLLIKNLVWKH